MCFISLAALGNPSSATQEGIYKGTVDADGGRKLTQSSSERLGAIVSGHPEEEPPSPLITTSLSTI